MHRKVLLGTFVFMLLLANFPSIALVTTTTTLYVDPQMTMVPKMGDSFAVNITVSDVTDLAGWEFKLYYNSSMLNATSITEGPFLKTGGSTYLMVVDFTDNYNASHGRIWASCVMMGTGPGVNGTGTLATISFKTKLPGVSNLHLINTLLCNSETDPQLIPHVTINGVVNVLIHSLAVVNVTPFKTIVGRGLALRINTTVTNQGDSDEIFNVTAYANETIIETRTNIILTSGSSTTITLTWDTTGIPYGNYIISAYAWVAPGETDISDNTLTDGWVLVTVPGDVNGDGKCNILDVKMVKLAYSGIIKP